MPPKTQPSKKQVRKAVKRAVRKVVKKERRQAPRRRRAGRSSAVAYVARDNTVGVKHKHYLRIMSHKDDSMIVEGFEPFLSVETPAGLDVALNTQVVDFTANLSELPRLSAVSTMFERYRLKRCSFQFVPVMPTTSNGTVYQGLLYDPLGEPFTTSAEFLQAETHTYGPIWRPSEMSMDGKLVTKPWFFTSTTSPEAAGSANYRLDCPFTFNLGIGGLTNDELNREVGVIFCRYQVEFEGVRMPQPVASSVVLHSESNGIPASPADVSVTIPTLAPKNSPLQFRQVQHTFAQLGNTENGWGQFGAKHLFEIPRGYDFRAMLTSVTFTITHVVAQGVNHDYTVKLSVKSRTGALLTSNFLTVTILAGQTSVVSTNNSFLVSWATTDVVYVGVEVLAASVLTVGTRSITFSAGRLSVIRTDQTPLALEEKRVDPPPMTSYELPAQYTTCVDALSSFSGTVLLSPNPPEVTDIEDLTPEQMAKLHRLLREPLAAEPPSPSPSFVEVRGAPRGARAPVQR